MVLAYFDLEANTFSLDGGMDFSEYRILKPCFSRIVFSHKNN